MRVHVQRILHNGKALILAGDAGGEGITGFTLTTIQPKYLFDIALEGNFTAISVNPGIAEKYHHTYYKDVPLIVNVTNVAGQELASVEHALKLGASGIGVYVQPGIINNLPAIIERAHDYGIPVIAYVSTDTRATDVLARAARFLLEVGVDAIELPYNNDPQGFSWIVQCAGSCRVIIADPSYEVIQRVHQALTTGVVGVRLGKTIWQHDKPFSIARALRKIIVEGHAPEETERP